MSLRKLNSLLLFAALFIAAVSCKDDDETESLPELSGMYFECPLYVAPGQEVTMIPKVVEHPEGGTVKYAWKVTPSMSSYDTLDVFVHRFSDTLQTYTVNAYAFAEGYYSSSFTREVAVVKGGLNGTITKTGIRSSDKKITVDGADYYYQKIGNLEWFRNNLVSKASGTPYVNLDVMSDVFGRYYNYDEAMTACPDGWRLPTEDDWMSLAEAIGSPAAEKYAMFDDVAAKLLANASFNGKTILEYWPVVGDVTNSSGLAMIPFGFANLGNADENGRFPGASFDGVFEYVVMWTADKVDGEADMAYYRYMRSDRPEMLVGTGDVKTFGASVRCVRDAK